MKTADVYDVLHNHTILNGYYSYEIVSVSQVIHYGTNHALIRWFYKFMASDIHLTIGKTIKLVNAVYFVQVNFRLNVKMLFVR